MTLTATFPSVVVEYQKSAPSGTFGIVNLDFDQVWDSREYRFYQRVSRNTRNGVPYSENVPSYYGVPATARFSLDTPVDFKRDLQFWIHGINHARSQQSEAKSKRDFGGMFRDDGWITNFAGTDTRADYINNNGLPPEIRIQPMATGGSYLKIVGETTYRQVEQYIVEAINPTVDFRSYSFETHKWLFFPPTISCRHWTRDKKGNFISKEEFYSEPYPAYGENTLMPVFGFRKDDRSSTGFTNLIPKNRVKILMGRIPTPYIMRFGRWKPNPYE